MTTKQVTPWGGRAAGLLVAIACLSTVAWAGQPNLTYVTPTGWGGPIVVSVTTGTNIDSQNLPPYTTTNNLFVDIAVTNSGNYTTNIVGVVTTGGTTSFSDSVAGPNKPFPADIVGDTVRFTRGAAVDASGNVTGGTLVGERVITTLPNNTTATWAQALTVQAGDIYEIVKPFWVRIEVDDQGPATSDGIFQVDGLAVGQIWTKEDIDLGTLSEGWHNIRMIIDPQGVLDKPNDPPYRAMSIAESNEQDNEPIAKTIEVKIPKPTITSGATSTGTAGQPWSYQIEAKPMVTTYEVTGIPKAPGYTDNWWTIDTSSGLISGTYPVDAAGPGNVTFTMTVSADNSTGRTSLAVVVTISPAPPIIDSPKYWYALLGEPMATYTVTYKGSRATLAVVPPIPAGFVWASPNLNGTPSQSGIIPLTITATNVSGQDRILLRIEVGAPPIITSDLNYDGTYKPTPFGVPFNYQIVATDNPFYYDWKAAPSSTLPPGLDMNKDSGVISGVPTAAGTYTVYLYATNKYGSGTATMTIGIRDDVKPALIAPTTVHAHNLVNFYYFIDTTPPPADNTNWYVGDPVSSVRPLTLTNKVNDTPDVAITTNNAAAFNILSGMAGGTTDLPDTGAIDLFANATDGTTVTVGDGLRAPVTFEFDTGNGVTGTNTPVKIGTDGDASLWNLGAAISQSGLDITTEGGFLRWRTVAVGSTPPYGATHMRYAVAGAQPPGIQPRMVSVCDVPRVGPIRTNFTGEIVAIAGRGEVIPLTAKGIYVANVTAAYLDDAGVEQSVTRPITIIVEAEQPHITSSKLGIQAKRAGDLGDPGGGGQAFNTTFDDMAIWGAALVHKGGAVGDPGDYFANPPTLGVSGNHANDVGLYWYRINGFKIIPPPVICTMETDPWPYVPVGLRHGSVVHNPGTIAEHWHHAPTVPMTSATLYVGSTVNLPLGVPGRAAVLQSDRFTPRNDGLTGVPNPDFGNHAAAADLDYVIDLAAPNPLGLQLVNGALTGIPRVAGTFFVRVHDWTVLPDLNYIYDPLAGDVEANPLYQGTNFDGAPNDAQTLHGFGCMTLRIEHICVNQPIVVGPTAFVGPLNANFNFSVGVVNGGAMSVQDWGTVPAAMQGTEIIPTTSGFMGNVPNASVGVDAFGVAGPYEIRVRFANAVTGPNADQLGRANTFLTPDTVQRRDTILTLVFYNASNDKPKLLSPLKTYATELVPFQYKAVSSQNAYRIEAVTGPTQYGFPPNAGPPNGDPPVGGTYMPPPTGDDLLAPNQIYNANLPFGLKLPNPLTADSSVIIDGIPAKGTAEYVPSIFGTLGREVMRPKYGWIMLKMTAQDPLGGVDKVGFGVVNLMIYPSPPNIQPTMDFATVFGFDRAQYISPSFADIVGYPDRLRPEWDPCDHPEYTPTGYVPRAPNPHSKDGYVIQTPRSAGGFVYDSAGVAHPPGRGPQAGDSRDVDTFWDMYVYAPYDSNWGKFFSGSNIPAGLTLFSMGTFTDQPPSGDGGLVGGVLQSVSHNRALVRAQNTFGSDARMVFMGAVPVEITSPMLATAYVGLDFSYTIAGTGAPYDFKADGLPPGLSINTATGEISGKPLRPSDEDNPYGDPGLPLRHFELVVHAKNRWSEGTQSLCLTVIQDRKIPLIVDPLKAPNRTPFLAEGYDGKAFYFPWSPTRSFTAGARNPANGTTITINDGVGGDTIFEFRTDVVSVAPRIRVQIDQSGIDETNKTLLNLQNAIVASGIQIDTSIPEPFTTLLLTNRNPGVAGNQTIRTISPAIFAVSGMLGGAVGVAAKGVITFVRDGPYYPAPTGLLITNKTNGAVNYPITTSSPLVLIVSNVTGGDASTPAAGTIALAQQLPYEGDTVTLTDGTLTRTFEFDTNASVTAGNIAVDGSNAALGVILVRLRDAINAAGLNLTAALDSRSGYRVTVASNPPDPNDPLKPLYPPTTYYAVKTKLPPGLNIDATTGVISGTPVGYGKYDVIVTVTNVWGISGVVLHFDIKPTAPTITSTPSARGIVGLPFNTWDNAYTITATGSAGIKYAVDQLPPGLAMSGAVITGTPTQAGAVDPATGLTLPMICTVTASNDGGAGAPFPLAIYIYERPAITNNPPTFTCVVGEAFSYQITHSGSPDDMNIIVGGALPDGVFQAWVDPPPAQPNLGLLTGTAEKVGDWVVPISAINITGPTYVDQTTVDFTFTVVAMQITSPLTWLGVVGQQIPQYQITATGSPTNFAASGLPDGLALGSGGIISGIPTEYGSFPVYIEATNQFGKAWAWLTIGIASQPGAPVIISPLSAQGYVDMNPKFSYAIQATNMTAADGPPLTYNAVVNDPNYPGLTLEQLLENVVPPMDPTTGMISGTPKVAGTFQVTISATNSIGTGSATLVLAISTDARSPAINSPLTGECMAGSQYTYQTTATNSPDSFKAVFGVGPNGEQLTGLTIDPTTGTISGFPDILPIIANRTDPVTFPIELTATNGFGSGTATLNLVVYPKIPPIWVKDPDPDGVYRDSVTWMVGVQASYVIAAKFAQSYGVEDPSTLPPGIQEPVGNILQGTPLLMGSYVVVVTASNAYGTARLILSINVTAAPAGAPVITSPDPPGGVVGEPYSYTITAEPGATSFTVYGDLPPGLNLPGSNGVIAGTPTAAGTYTVIIGASNNIGLGTKQVTFTVIAPTPLINSPTTWEGWVGIPLVPYQITASGIPPITYTASGLPPGLALVGSAIVNDPNGPGWPSVAGTYTVTIYASNIYTATTGPTQAQVTFIIHDPLPPTITVNVATPVQTMVGVQLPTPITVTVTGSQPVTTTVTGVPSGMSAVILADGSVIISGAPDANALPSNLVTITCTNAAGTVSYSFVINVMALVPGTDTDNDGFSDELEIFLGSNPLDPNSTPFGGKSGTGEPFHMPKPKLSIKLDFTGKPNKDTVVLTGTLPVPAGFTAPGKQMVMDVGGVMIAVNLDAKGSFKSSDKTVAVKLNAGKSSPVGVNAKYSMKLKGNFKTQLADEGLINKTVKGESLKVEVVVLLMQDQLIYQKTQGVQYTAKLNKSGTAK